MEERKNSIKIWKHYKQPLSCTGFKFHDKAHTNSTLTSISLVILHSDTFATAENEHTINKKKKKTQRLFNLYKSEKHWRKIENILWFVNASNNHYSVEMTDSLSYIHYLLLQLKFSPSQCQTAYYCKLQTHCTRPQCEQITIPNITQTVLNLPFSCVERKTKDL